MLRVDFEEGAQRGARVAAAEAIRAERHIFARHVRPDEIRHRPHVVAGSDDRALGSAKTLLHPARRLAAEAPRALGLHAVAAQLGERGHAPHAA